MPADATAGHRSLPCCGVMVVAAAAGVTFGRAWDTLAQLHDSDVDGYQGPHWRGRVYDGATTFVDRACALYALGVRWRHEVMNTPTKLYVWERDIAQRGVSYVVMAGQAPRSRHVMLIRDGMVLDQAGIVPIGYHFARHLVLDDILVLKEPRQ